MDGAGEIFGVYYGYSWRSVEMEHGFGDGDVFPPITEAEFGFGVAGFADYDSSEVIVGIDFEKDLAERGTAFVCRCGVPRGAVQYYVARIERAVRGRDAASRRRDQVNLAAETIQVNFAGEQGERRAPIVAFFQFGAAGGAIGWYVEPDIYSVHEEKFGEGGFVFPAHAARLREIDCAGFGSARLAGCAIALVEFGSERVGAGVAGFYTVHDLWDGLRGVWEE